LEKEKIISELAKRIEQLESQLKEVKSYIWKPRIQTISPKKIGPPANHEPHNRTVPDTIHEKKELSLSNCPDCGSNLSKPIRTRKRYVEDIRSPEPLNTEYTIPYYWCKPCRKQVSPKPVGVIPKCRFGMRLMLYVTFLKYGISIPYNKIISVLEQCFGIAVSEGYLVGSITKFADYLGPEFERIKSEIRKADVVYNDTTGWRINGNNKVLWDFISEQYELLLIRDTKSKGIIYQTLGKDFTGISVNDCARENKDLGWAQQKCWAHVLRRSRKLESGEGKQLHQTLKALHKLGVNRKGMQVGELLESLDSACSAQYSDPKCSSLVKWLRVYREQWFTFVGEKGVESTNNIAERGLRPSVVMRKITGGNRSPIGARNHEVIMSVMGTWNKQDKDFFEEGLKALQ
jgi:transposase